MHHLYDPSFPAKFRKLVEGRFKRYGHFEFDTEGEIEMYLVSLQVEQRSCRPLQSASARTLSTARPSSTMRLSRTSGSSWKAPTP